MTLNEIKTAIAATPDGIHFDAYQEGDDLIIATSLSYDGEPWPDDVIGALAGAVGIGAERFAQKDSGCSCCGYMASIIAANYFAAPLPGVCACDKHACTNAVPQLSIKSVDGGQVPGLAGLCTLCESLC